MNRPLALFGALLVWGAAATARADTVTLVFTDPNTPAATSYTFAQRPEGTAAWTLIPVAQVTTTCTGTAPGKVCQAVIAGIAATGTVLFQYSLTTGGGSATRFGAGGWYCGNCSPLAATGTGIQ